MIYGRIIFIGDTYFNKIMDADGYSYFVALNRTTMPYIKVHTPNLDKKVFIYPTDIVESQSNLFSKLIPLDTILSYTPFVKGSKSKRKNYYKESKKKANSIQIVHGTGILTFD